MKLIRKDRSLIAWVLYSSILFAALVCAVGHGQVAGLQLSGLDAGYCSLQGGSADDMGLAAPILSSESCVLSSSFSAIILAAFFGLFGRLAADSARPLPAPPHRHPARHAWPPANPRASPFLTA